MPDDGMDSSAFLMDGGLEDELGGGSGWNQFEVNKSKFGVTSTFDENIYTTRLDKDSCAISEREAARIAAEIEGHGYSSHGVGYNAHIAEERGFEIDDGQMDEEDKYSSVLGVRSAPAGMPPAAPPKSALPPRQAMQGGGPSSSSSGGGASKAPAWSSSGAGVAAVAGAVGAWLLQRSQLRLLVLMNPASAMAQLGRLPTAAPAVLASSLHTHPAHPCHHPLQAPSQPPPPPAPTTTSTNPSPLTPQAAPAQAPPAPPCPSRARSPSTSTPARR